MTDRYDEMRVPPDPSLAEALRQRLHARMARVSWDDHEGRSHLQLDAARLEPEPHLVPVKEIYVSLNSSPTSETGNRRRLSMAAAAVVAVIGVAAIAINIRNSEGDDGPAPAAEPTVAPTTVAPTTTVAATTGTYILSEEHPLGATNSDVRLTFAVPAGWEDNGWYVDKPPADPSFGVVFDYVANIYTDSCPSVLVDPPVGPTVDDLASAWANLPGFDATAASDITVDGFHGKQIEFTVPDYTPSECSYGDFKLLNAVGGGDWWAQGPNQHNKLWILDVNGTRFVIIAAYFPDTSPQDRAAIDEILASIQIAAAPTVAPPTTVAQPTTVATETISFAVASANDIPVTFTAPVDWIVAEGWSAYKDGIGGAGTPAGVLFDGITNIYAEGCQWVLVDPPVGPTADDLVEAFANVPDLATTAAVDVTVDGYAGKQFEFTVPDYTPSECRGDKYALWDVPGQEVAPGYRAQGPNHHFQVWVLDVDGTRLVIGAGTFPNTSPQDRAALDEIVASIQIR